ncbi:MAG: hypothetical protein SPE54_10930, partial [Sodaliphilus sp.]|nr:hypothetical protein [Sodaliphilus sp.]
EAQKPYAKVFNTAKLSLFYQSPKKFQKIHPPQTKGNQRDGSFGRCAFLMQLFVDLCDGNKWL